MSIEYTPKQSSMQYYIPKTLASDFDAFLQNDIPGAVGNFTVIRDWYNKEQNWVIRGQIYPNASKSDFDNADNKLNFRASVYADIKKGDMLDDGNGTIYVVDWDIAPQPNNKATRALRCNSMCEFSRPKQEQIDDLGYVVVDDEGYVVQDSGYQIVAGEIPCNIYQYTGRPEYNVYSGTPGIMPNALIIATVQYNDATKELKINDQFNWGDSTYIIVDINYVAVNYISGNGVLALQARKKAGGSI